MITMKLVQVSKSEVNKIKRKSKYEPIILEFKNSNMECAEIQFNSNDRVKVPDYSRNAIMVAIKRLNLYDDIRVFVNNGKVYLERKLKK